MQETFIVRTTRYFYFLFIPTTQRVISTMIAVFLFTRGIRQYEIYQVKPNAYGIPFFCTCHGDYGVVGQVVVCGCVLVHHMTSNRGCIKIIQQNTSMYDRNHSNENIMCRPGNYSTFFPIFCTFVGHMPQVLKYYALSN